MVIWNSELLNCVNCCDASDAGLFVHAGFSGVALPMIHNPVCNVFGDGVMLAGKVAHYKVLRYKYSLQNLL